MYQIFWFYIGDQGIFFQMTDYLMVFFSQADLVNIFPDFIKYFAFSL